MPCDHEAEEEEEEEEEETKEKTPTRTRGARSDVCKTKTFQIATNNTQAPSRLHGRGELQRVDVEKVGRRVIIPISQRDDVEQDEKALRRMWRGRGWGWGWGRLHGTENTEQLWHASKLPQARKRRNRKTNLDDNVDGGKSKAHIVNVRRISPANDLRLRGQVGNINCRGKEQDHVDLQVDMQTDSNRCKNKDDY
jgi:hypothetical protein